MMLYCIKHKSITLSLFSFLFLVFLSSCDTEAFNNTTYLMRRSDKPLTKKESIFIRELQLKGFFNIKIKSPYIGEGPLGWSCYNISMESNNIASYKNIDSLKKIQFLLAREIYNNVLEDSIKDDISYLSFEWKMKATGMSYKKIGLNFSFDVEKLQIEDTLYI